jgi:hypothetical protein
LKSLDEDEQAKPVMVFNFQGHVVDVHAVQGTHFYRRKRGILIESGGMETMEID